MVIMKPDGGVDEKAMEAAEVEPSEFFVELGMLVLESRLPVPSSVKGRQDGPHCPPAVGDRLSHVCDISQPLCKRASEMQKQMLTLWRNHIPMCIEVLLFPHCTHGRQRATSTDVAPPINGDGCILLERWTIQLVAKKYETRRGCVNLRQMENCISSKALFQAMRSYLHFSQLSAWLNLTHGNEPRNIGYRVSPPAEFCTTAFGEAPDSHLFPLATASKSTNIKVTLAHLPRLPGIPKPVCHESAGKQPCLFVPEHAMACGTKSSSLAGSNTSLQTARSNSPKLDKPNVLHALTAEEREVLTRPSKCLCAECVGNKLVDSVPARQETNTESKIAAAYPKSSPDLIGDSAQRKSPVSFTQESTSQSSKSAPKDVGAIPKRFSLQLRSIPEDLVVKLPRSPQQHLKATQANDDKTTNLKQTDLRHYPSTDNTLPQNLPSFISHHKDLIPEVLPSLLMDGGESSGSSPDYDHFLSKTLMKQSEPLTLCEMEAYLQHLYQQNSNSRVSGFGGNALNQLSGKLKQQQTCDKDFKRSFPLCDELLDDEYERNKLSKEETMKDSDVSHKPSEQTVRVRLEPEFSKTKSSEAGNLTQASIMNNRRDHTIGKHDLTYRSSESEASVVLTQPNPQLMKPGDFRPIFTVGDTEEGDEKQIACLVKETAISLVPGDAFEKSQAKDNDECDYQQQQRPSLHKSVSCPSKPAFKSTGTSNKANSLLKTVMKKELIAQQATVSNASPCVPTSQEKIYFGQCVQKSASMVFHATTGLPLQSSPVPAKRMSSNSFDYDSSINSVRAIKSSLSCISLDAQNEDGTHLMKVRQSYSTSAPASTNCLLGNFEESLINGRIEPAGVVNGFTVDIGASGSFCPQHITLPVTAFFFSLSDDNAPSPYLGHINLESYSKRGYHVPKQGTVQVTLFNPNKTVVKMFVVKYDVSDMPPNHQTVLRQRTLYMPVKGSPSDMPGVMVYLRYLIHLRFASSKTSKIYLHTDIRVIFARDKFELDSRVANYELRSFTERPENPKFSPRK